MSIQTYSSVIIGKRIDEENKQRLQKLMEGIE